MKWWILTIVLTLGLFLLVKDNFVGVTGGPEHTRNGVRLQMKNIEMGLTSYRLYTGKYPNKLEDMLVNPGIEGWKKCIRGDKLPKDAWNNNFVYRKNGNDFTLISYGADGQPGGEDMDTDIILESR